MGIHNDNEKGKKVKLGIIFVVVIIVSAIVGAAGLLVLFKVSPEFASQTITNINKSEKEVTVVDNGIADAVEKIYDSVVVVETFKNNTLYATGSGFVYKKDGDSYYLLTNHHVIASGEQIKVVLTNGKELDVKVVGSDKYVDVAVLQLTTNEEYEVAELGESKTMRVGDTVFAIGAPLDSGVYSWSVTRGILSGKDRQVAVSLTNSYSSDYIMNVLQTDAAINSGNSGGPLCNSNGQVIGLTNMKLVTSGVEGMGFAIPIEDATEYAEALINGDDVSRPQIGIYLVDNNAYYAKEYGLTGEEDGVLVTDVVDKSPAKGKLKAGDLILAINDVEVESSAELRSQLYKYKVGDTITIKYVRNGKENTTKLVLTKNTDA